MNSLTPDENKAALAPPLAVVCRKVEKSFGQGNARTRALNGVDMEVRCGVMLMLVGPSGCGKTTLLSVIAGILDSDAGRVELFNQAMGDLRGAAKTRFRGRNIGFAFQQFNLLPQLTAQENAAIPLFILGWPRRKALARATEYLDKLGLADRRNNFPRQLSGGQQQRVAFARALIHEPRLVVCDEPTSALDGRTGEQVISALRSLAVGADRAVIVVTHDTRIFHFADRIAQMDDGRVLSTHTAREMLAKEGHKI